MYQSHEQLCISTVINTIIIVTNNLNSSPTVTGKHAKVNHVLQLKVGLIVTTGFPQFP